MTDPARTRDRAPASGQVLPFDEEAEEAVLGAALISPDAAAHVVSELLEDAFYIQRHRRVFRAIARLAAGGVPVDQITVVNDLRDHGELRELGDDSRNGTYPMAMEIQDLAVSVPVAASVNYYANIVRKHGEQRRLVMIFAKGREEATNGKDPAAVAEEVRSLLVPTGPRARRLTPLDWPALVAEGIPETRFLWRPYIPAGARVWAWGPAESGKSLWSLWVSAAMSRDGRDVVYFSAENPLLEDLRRLDRLAPDPARLRFFHDPGIDLSFAQDVRDIIEETKGADLIVFDTLSACWTGSENENDEINALDRHALAPIVRETGASVLVLDHTGHPQPFVKRRGVAGGRGASTKGQKADVVLEFRAEGTQGFRIAHGKARLGGVKADDAVFRVTDLDDGGLGVEETESSELLEVREMADRMVEAVETNSGEYLTTKTLRLVVGGQKDRQDDAMRLLEEEAPPRVLARREVVPTDGGRQRARVWRRAGDTLGV